MAKMKMKPGVVTGTALQEMFEYLKEQRCALPAVNVISSSSVNAALQAAREASSPIMIQFSNGGGVFNAGKYLDNTNQRAAIAGSAAGSDARLEDGRALRSSGYFAYRPLCA